MSQRPDYNAIAPDGLKAMGSVHAYIHKCGLDIGIIDLAFLRTSQINGCAYCIDMHSRDLLKNGMDLEKLLLVSVWHEAASLFTEEEKAALAFTESVTRVAETHVSDKDYEAAAAIFSEKQLVDLTLAISLMNAYNRMAISFRVLPAAAAEK
ncbi:carboxymuconolactone decarboxylase family protein [Lichenihabitans psoromatis]|uniref:carboxymuconolactone decarboxylase family protein n=1 Tax=Lichenihabitans psoromatis TaxID=2528642 RepID=UPI0010362BD1|nr:carboxymuconolactone decarboxylase family protein [Lichenihabitans psoromatis]